MTISVDAERLKIAENWFDAGRAGFRVGPDFSVNGTLWTPILFDGEEDPDLYKAESLEPE